MKAISFKLNEKDLEALKEKDKKSGKNRSEFIRKKIFDSDTSDTSGDTETLKKLLKPFVEKGIKVDLEEKEIERIKQLWNEVKNA